MHYLARGGVSIFNCVIIITINFRPFSALHEENPDPQEATFPSNPPQPEARALSFIFCLCVFAYLGYFRDVLSPNI